MGLKIEKISDIVPYTPEWFEDKKAKMSSSEIYQIMGEGGITKAGVAWIEGKVYEKLTGKSAKKEVPVTEDIVFGIENEPISIRDWCVKNNKIPLFEELYIAVDDIFRTTPDNAVQEDSFSVFNMAQTEMRIMPLETKSYKGAKHMAHVRCKTPDDIRKINLQLHWQIISQISWTESWKGMALFFNPEFKIGSPYRYGEVRYRRIDMGNDFKMFEQRTKEARNIYNNALNYGK
jgi:hypothetical protein